MIHTKNIYRLIVPIILLISLWPIAATGQTSDIPAAFADIGYGARPMGMGGAFVATADDANAVLWNPAGLVRLERSQLTGMYARQMGLVPYGFMGFGRPLSERMSIGAGAIYSGDAALREMTALFSAARHLMPGLDAGISAKARMASYGNNPDGAWNPDGTGNRQVQGQALGFGLDLGLLYDISERTSLGLLWRDILAPVSWQASNEAGTARGGGESIPMALVLGTAHRLNEAQIVSLNMDRSLSTDAADRIRLGYENRLWDMISLRGGYGQQVNADPDRLYSLGLGVAADIGQNRNVAFDFAYLFHHLANTPRFSLTLDF